MPRFGEPFGPRPRFNLRASCWRSISGALTRLSTRANWSARILHALPSWAKACAIFARGNKALDHFRANVIAVGLVEFIQPEVVAVKVQREFGRGVRVPSQITEVLHQHKRAIEFTLLQVAVFRNLE